MDAPAYRQRAWLTLPFLAQLIGGKMQQYDEFEAVVKIRSGADFVPRIEILRWNGRKVKAVAEFEIEHRKPYHDGEFACSLEDWKGERYPRGWIASGDLVIISRS
jgi:hypothetical protein